jgi:hypothetical protein
VRVGRRKKALQVDIAKSSWRFGRQARDGVKVRVELLVLLIQDQRGTRIRMFFVQIDAKRLTDR